MINPRDIARLITEDPDIFQEALKSYDAEYSKKDIPPS